MDDEPATEILHATSRVLCDNGYANLTLRDIAAEAERSGAKGRFTTISTARPTS